MARNYMPDNPGSSKPSVPKPKLGDRNGFPSRGVTPGSPGGGVGADGRTNILPPAGGGVASQAASTNMPGLPGGGGGSVPGGGLGAGQGGLPTNYLPVPGGGGGGGGGTTGYNVPAFDPGYWTIERMRNAKPMASNVPAGYGAGNVPGALPPPSSGGGGYTNYLPPAGGGGYTNYLPPMGGAPPMGASPGGLPPQVISVLMSLLGLA